jgi:hypothetical protein
MTLTVTWILFILVVTDATFVFFHLLSRDVAAYHFFFACFNPYITCFAASLPLYLVPDRLSIVKDIGILSLVVTQWTFNSVEPGHLMMHAVSDRCAEDIQNATAVLAAILSVLVSISLVLGMVSLLRNRSTVSRHRAPVGEPCPTTPP